MGRRMNGSEMLTNRSVWAADWWTAGWLLLPRRAGLRHQTRSGRPTAERRPPAGFWSRPPTGTGHPPPLPGPQSTRWQSRRRRPASCTTFTGVKFAVMFVPSRVMVKTYSPLGSLLNDIFGDDQAVGLFHQDAGIDELAGPKAQVLVGKSGLEPDGAGGGVNLIVNDRERPLVEYGFVVGAQGQDGDRTSGEFLIDGWTFFSGRVKTTEMGRNWVMTTRPLVSLAWTMLPWSTRRTPQRPPRGPDGAVIKLDLGAVDAGRVGLDGGLKLADQGLLGVNALLGYDVGQLKVARQIKFGVRQHRLVLRLFGLGLIQGGLVRAGVYLGEQIVGTDILPLFESHFDQLPVHSRGDGDGVEGLNGAQAVEINRDGFSHDGARGDRDGGAPCVVLAASAAAWTCLTFKTMPTRAKTTTARMRIQRCPPDLSGAARSSKDPGRGCAMGGVADFLVAYSLSMVCIVK